VSLPHPIRRPLGGEFDTSGLREFLRKSSSLLLMRLPSPLSLMWLPEGLHRSDVNSIAARRHVVGIPDIIQTDLLP
jgi:hypothetical protein